MSSRSTKFKRQIRKYRENLGKKKAIEEPTIEEKISDIKSKIREADYDLSRNEGDNIEMIKKSDNIKERLKILEKKLNKKESENVNNGAKNI